MVSVRRHVHDHGLAGAVLGTEYAAEVSPEPLRQKLRISRGNDEGGFETVMNRKGFGVLTLLLVVIVSVLAGCGYKEQYEKAMKYKAMYDRVSAELESIRPQLEKAQREAQVYKAEIERLFLENQQLRHDLQRYTGGVKKMYE